MLVLSLAVLVVAAEPAWSDEVVIGALEGAARPDVLDAVGRWVIANTALDVVPSDQAGWDRATLAGCEADRLYGCLASALLRVPSRPRLGILVSRASDREVQLLAFDAVAIEALMRAAQRPEDVEARVYGAVLRATGRGDTVAAAAGEALSDLRVLPGFDRPARLELAVRGCAGCVVRIGEREAAVVGDDAAIALARVRPGRWPLELRSASAPVATTTVQLAADATARISMDVPRPATALTVAAVTFAAAGAAAVGGGIALLAGRDEVLCVSRDGACGAGTVDGAGTGAYDDATVGGSLLVASGALFVATGVVLGALRLAIDDAPRITVE